jgi:hypothetical protein
MTVDGLRICVVGLHVVAKGTEKSASRSDVDGRERALEGVCQSRPHLGINLSESLSDIPRQGPAAEVPFHQLTDNMVAVGSASPISADKKLASSREACNEKMKCLFDIIPAGGEHWIPSQQLLQVTLHNEEFSTIRQGSATSLGERQGMQY